MNGALDDNGLRYATDIRVRAQGPGGAVAVAPGADGLLRARGASAVTIILAARTNYRLHYPDYRGADPVPAAASDAERASAKPIAQLASAHREDHARLFGRVALELEAIAGAALEPDHSALPTDQRLAAYGRGNAEVFFGALYENTRDAKQVVFASGDQPANDPDSVMLNAGWRYFGKGLTASFVFTSRQAQEEVSEYGFSMVVRVDL